MKLGNLASPNIMPCSDWSGFGGGWMFQAVGRKILFLPSSPSPLHLLSPLSLPICHILPFHSSSSSTSPPPISPPTSLHLLPTPFYPSPAVPSPPSPPHPPTHHDHPEQIGKDRVFKYCGNVGRPEYLPPKTKNELSEMRDTCFWK